MEWYEIASYLVNLVAVLIWILVGIGLLIDKYKNKINGELYDLRHENAELKDLLKTEKKLTKRLAQDAADLLKLKLRNNLGEVSP